MKTGLIEQRSISSDDPFLPEYFKMVGNDFGGAINIGSGDTAMKIATVYRCVSILSGTIASIPMLVRRKKDNFLDVDDEHPLYSLLTWKANPRQNSYNFFENAVIQMLMDGNAYIMPKWKGGEVSEIVLCSPNSVSYDAILDKYHIYDFYNGIKGTYESWQVLHLKNKSLDGGITGVSTVRYAATILNVAANADNQTLKGLKSGNQMKGFITGGVPAAGMGTYQDAQVDKVADRLESEIGSGKNIMRIPGGTDFKQISINPADAQLLENRKFSVFDICRFFGVHPDKVFAEQTSNYKASENSQTSFLTDTLTPILAQFEAEFNSKLIPRPLIKVQKIQFDLSALYKADPTTRANYYKKMQEIGALTTNEIRNKENLSPVDGGDVAFVSCNVAPINSAKIRGEKSPSPSPSPLNPPKGDLKSGEK